MLSHNPLVSIIIPVYNVENYIQRCLCSISKIDYNPFEVILVDDSSQDHSAVIAESFLRSNPNWRILHKAKNEGVTRARISGVEQASGRLQRRPEPGLRLRGGSQLHHGRRLVLHHP